MKRQQHLRHSSVQGKAGGGSWGGGEGAGNRAGRGSARWSSLQGSAGRPKLHQQAGLICSWCTLQRSASSAVEAGCSRLNSQDSFLHWGTALGRTAESRAEAPWTD